ncbi:MAG TPA: translocation/assembly module TamB domain-containing protein [Saprospiraceae bacterium]|nr:translocation/assembly module TamB domain-containing protein [Saprospiraceae bacterium]HMQ82058.1 translocation/assembly module TamB domain-containing protein [Saprospiraceae bacterium]
MQIGRTSWRWINRIVFLLLLLLLTLFVVIQLPVVQNFLVKKLTESLNKTLQTEVRIERLNLAFLDKLILEKLYIKDYSMGDTLLYSKRLYANINLNPIVYVLEGLVVEEISLDGAIVNIRRAADEEENHLQMMLHRLLPPKDTSVVKKDKKPFRFNLEKLRLNDVQFLKDDQLKGQRLSIYIQQGSAVMEKMDFPGNFIHAKTLFLNAPFIRIDEREYAYIPDEAPIELTEDSIANPFRFQIDHLQMEKGKFVLHNWRKDPLNNLPENEINYEHLDVLDIEMDFRQFRFSEEGLTFDGIINHLAMRELSGFELQSLCAGEAHVSCDGAYLHGMTLMTPYSGIGDTLEFKYNGYPAWEDFNNMVTMYGNVSNSYVALRDIMAFAPALKENTFFRNNQDRSLGISGIFKGRVNKLEGKELNLYMTGDDNSLVIDGEFSSRDLANRGSELLNLNLSNLLTNMKTLRELLPGFNPPENFSRLGNLYFTGKFDGYFTNFVAYGLLNTSLGQAEMDMGMDLKQGRDKAQYSGTLTLRDFDLGKWSDNPNFGIVNFKTTIKDGKGITAQNASANLSAEVQNFEYKNYSYDNATLTGELNTKGFTGDFNIQDDNIDLNFNGKVVWADSLPKYDLKASVKKLDLYRLNISKKELILSGNVVLDLAFKSFSNLNGTGSISQFLIQHPSIGNIPIDSIELFSESHPEAGKRFILQSDVAEAEIIGLFDLEKIPDVVFSLLQQNYPEFYTRLKLKPINKTFTDHRFNYRVDIRDSKKLLYLIDEKLHPIQEAVFEGSLDNTSNTTKYNLEIPRFVYDKIALNDLRSKGKIAQGDGQISFSVVEPIINEKTSFQPVNLTCNLYRDTLEIGLNYSSDKSSVIDVLNLDSKLFLADSLNFGLSFKQSNLIIFNTPWLVADNNSITFRKGFIDTKDFLLTNGNRRIQLTDTQEKGLRLLLSNFDFSSIDELWDYDELDFGGRFGAEVYIANIFKMQGINARVLADTFMVNDSDWGTFSLDVTGNNLKDTSLHYYLNISRDTAQMIVEGKFNPSNLRPGDKIPNAQRANYFDFYLDVTNFPLNIAEYWLGDNISNSTGSFSADLHIFGLPAEPNIEGFIEAKNGAITVDFLHTRYYFDRAHITAGNQLFDASKTILKDKYGNTAEVRGGVTHQYLKNLGLDARLTTTKFLALDTDKGDNDMFYGHAIGNGDVLFTGPLNKIDIYINASVGKDTRLTIPINSSQGGSELTYIKFVQPEPVGSTAKDAKRGNTGISVEMDLSISEEATCQIIFDEKAGDIIKGSGRGNLRILLPRNGSFQMYGDYLIEKGEYLFTLYGLVNKGFTVKKGGIITWSGDPYRAQIKLEAEYKDLFTSTSNFIQEYLESAPEALRQDANKATSVSLGLNLNGDLLQPDITFDIQFPQLVGALKNFTDSKLRVIQSDPNELNRQVFGLLVVGQFLPSDLATIQGSGIFYKTVSEMVSNQLSLLLSELFTDLSDGSSTFSGTDLDIAYNQYNNFNFDGGTNISGGGDAFQVQLRQELFSDKLVIQIGGNVDINNSAATSLRNGAFVGNDLVIEYAISKDRSLKLKIYQTLEPDIGGGSRLEVGTGLSYRKEFDSFGDFWRSLLGKGG